jgi:hypothetical protein
MRVKRLVVCVATLLLVGDVAARAKPAPSSVEMLEFLGTYETAGGEDVDPLELAGAAALEKVSAKSGSEEAEAVKGKIKEKGRRL